MQISPTYHQLPATVAAAVKTASLPAEYENARTALAECDRLDVCRDWADKAAALASYAKQADDPELENFARRIRARAVRRCGELLREFDGRGGDRSKTEGDHVFALSRANAAAEAGISEHKALTAVRVAAIADEKFEAMVESKRPPGTTLLAQLGRTPRVELASTTTEAHLSEVCRNVAAANVIEAIDRLRIAAERADVSAVVNLLADERNVARLPDVHRGIAFAIQIRDALDKAGLRKKPKLSCVE